jgi:hypothetical protein
MQSEGNNCEKRSVSLVIYKGLWVCGIGARSEVEAIIYFTQPCHLFAYKCLMLVKRMQRTIVKNVACNLQECCGFVGWVHGVKWR